MAAFTHYCQPVKEQDEFYLMAFSSLSRKWKESSGSRPTRLNAKSEASTDAQVKRLTPESQPFDNNQLREPT
jgi:hypothetical protein